MTSLMTSPGHKIGQILKLIYLRQYLNYSFDQKLKMSEMLMAIFMMMMTSSITSHGDLKVGPLHSFIYEITFFMITEQRANISSITFPCICVMGLWLQLYDIYIHDVIDDVTRAQNRSNFEINISPSIFELQRRSKPQNVENAHGYLSGIFNFLYNFR